MKIISTYTGISIIIFTWMLSSCELDRIPESDLSDAVFWQTPDDYKKAANYLYRASHVDAYDDSYILRADNMSDNTFARDPNEISNGSYIPSANFGPWVQDYRVIRAANNIIEKASESSLSVDVLAQYISEARFFRAFAYFDLVSRYGDVPLIMKSLDIDNEELYSPRTNRGIVIDTIFSDLDYAAAHLPKASLLIPGTDYGRITSGAAFAFKSRVALFEGTFNKFHDTDGLGNPGKVASQLKAAKDAAENVMKSAEYKLFDKYGLNSYEMLFKDEGEGPDNKETIWTYIYGFTQTNNVNTNNFALQMGRNGDMCITRSLVDAFLCVDGLPIDKSPLYKGTIYAGSEFENRDPRLDGTVVKPGQYYFNGYLYILNGWIPSMSVVSGYPVEKYLDEKTGSLDHVMIRYAEVLLNYAEAAYELSGNITDADLDISVNLLRKRVGLPNLTNAFAATNNLNMREEIRRERRIELGMEGFRYNDLIRWKIAEVELPKAIYGVRFFPKQYPGTVASSLKLTPDSVVIVEADEKRNFDPAKNYLWPIPLNELSLNKNLQQNPNW